MRDKRKILLIIAVIFLGIILLLKVPLSNLVTRLGVFPSPTPAPTAKPFRPALPQGRQEYNISHGEGTAGPDIRQVVIDPFDPKRGEMQKFRVLVLSEKGVKSVVITLYTDGDQATQALNLAEGDEKNGVWEGSTTVLTTHDNLYRLHVKASDGKDTSKVELSFR